jgi:hypothetical protein
MRHSVTKLREAIRGACEEIFAYCEANKALIEAEANEERQRLNRANVDVEARA